MKNRVKVPLLALIILAASLVVGFAIAQALEDPSDSREGPGRLVDPDPSTDPIHAGEELQQAMESGDAAEIERAGEAVRKEALSRMSPEERAAAESSPPEPKVPPGTYAYINEAIGEGQIESCRDLLSKGRDDVLCELIVLYGEGKIEAGPYTLDEVHAVLGDNEGDR